MTGVSGLVQQSCSEGLLQNEEEEEAETLQCSWGGTVDTDQSRALSSPLLHSGLVRKRKKKGDVSEHDPVSLLWRCVR